MEPTKRIIVNTTAQYAKAIINIFLAFYSTRIVLDALNVSDFGVYSVVGGVVIMLGFMTNALIITTQRYISFQYGRRDSVSVRRTFTNSLLLHIVIGLSLVCVLVALQGWLFNSVLNIELSRIETARSVYFITVFMLVVSIISAPFKALFIARENIVYVSVVDVCDGILKFVFALVLTYVTVDKLLVYAWLMALIQVLNLLAFSLYAHWRFEECHFRIRRCDIDSAILAQIAGFAGWTTYSIGALATRNQGIAIVFNHFLGTVVNAAYGVAMQVGNSIFFVSSSIVNAMNPQIMKAEGASDRGKMLNLAGQESKFSVMLLSLVSIPIMMELPQLLGLWLKEVPEGTPMFCSFMLAACLCDQFTIGLNAANQATGHIREYTLLMFTPKLIILPLAYLLLRFGYKPVAVMWFYVAVEALVAIARIPFMHFTCGLNTTYYVRNTILPVIPLIAALVAASWLCTQSFHFPFRFLLTISTAMTIGCITAWRFTLSNNEREYLVLLVKKKIGR